MRTLLEKILPNVNIALSLALMTVAVFNIFNPMMGFFYGRPINVLVFAECIVSLINGISAYTSWRKRRITEREKEVSFSEEK